MRIKSDWSRRRRVGNNPQARFLACFRAVRLAYRSLGLERDELLALAVSLYHSCREDLDLKLIFWDWKSKSPNLKRVVSESEYEEIRNGAKAASYKVFGDSDFRGMSTDDIASEVVIDYFQKPIQARSAIALGRTAGHWRATSLATRTPKAVEFSAIANDGPMEPYFLGQQQSSEASIFLGEIIDTLCGDKNSVDRKIVEMRKDEMTYREIAASLGMKPSATRERFNSFRRKAIELFGKAALEV